MATRSGRFFGMVLVVLATLSVSLYAETDPAAPGKTNVSFRATDGAQLRGYLSLPTGSGRAPAVLMIHEWWGLNNDVTALADSLSAKGFVVLAADAFRGSVAETPQDAMKQVRGTPAAQIASDLDAALEYLKTNSRVDANRVAVLGFCFGGTQAMYMGTRRADLAGVVIFYGSGPITDEGSLGVMKEAGPVLGIYGAEDGNIPVAQVEGFRAALNARAVENTIQIYPGVGHAFVKSTTFQNGAQAEQAWNQMVAFLDNTL